MVTKILMDGQTDIQTSSYFVLLDVIIGCGYQKLYNTYNFIAEFFRPKEGLVITGEHVAVTLVVHPAKLIYKWRTINI